MTLTWQEAEELAALHLRQYGFPDAIRTPDGTDGGIDVRGTGIVGQVKHHIRPVGAPDVQRLRGAEPHASWFAFYSSSGYTPAAFTAAEVGNVALFLIESSDLVSPVNQGAVALASRLDRLDFLDELIQSWRSARGKVHDLVGDALPIIKRVQSDAHAAKARVDGGESGPRIDAEVARLAHEWDRVNPLVALVSPVADGGAQFEEAQARLERRDIEGAIELVAEFVSNVARLEAALRDYIEADLEHG